MPSSKDQAHRATLKLAALESSIARVDGDTVSRCLKDAGLGLLGFGGAGVMGLLTMAAGFGVLAVATGVAAAFGVDTGSSPGNAALLALGAVGLCLPVAAVIAIPTAVSAARGHVASKRIAKDHAHALASLDSTSAATTGLSRAWLATRAQHILASLEDSTAGLGGWCAQFFSGRGSGPSADSLRRAAATSEGCSAADLAEAAAMHEAFDLVVRDGSPRPELSADLERLIEVIERLSPTARDFVQPLIKEPVIASLEAEQGNRYRIRRFTEALAGTRTPYAAATAEDFPAAPLARTAPLLAGTHRAVELLAGRLRDARTRGERVEVATTLADAPAAEHLAAYFELHGYRAALFETGSGVRVTVYDPASPPSDIRADAMGTAEESAAHSTAGS